MKTAKLKGKQQKELDALVQKAVYGYQIPIMELSQVSAAGEKAYLAGEDVDKAVKDFMHHKNYKKSAASMIAALEVKLANEFISDQEKHDAILEDLASAATHGDLLTKVKHLVKQEAEKIAKKHGVKVNNQIRTNVEGVKDIDYALEIFVGMALNDDKSRIGSHTLKFFSGPGHGWLEVPESLYKDSGISASRFSFYSKNKKMVYLEEDSDAPKFEKAMKEKGKHFNTEHKNVDDDSFIRNLGRMPGY